MKLKARFLRWWHIWFWTDQMFVPEDHRPITSYNPQYHDSGYDIRIRCSCGKEWK